MSSFSELPFSVQENSAIVAITGLSLDTDQGTLVISGTSVISLAGLGLDINPA
jgi:hypothetical protein